MYNKFTESGPQPSVHFTTARKAEPGPNELFITNRFTLTGTVKDPSCLQLFHGACHLPGHYPYSSVGVVTKAGLGAEHRVGQALVFSPHYTKDVCVPLHSGVDGQIFISNDLDPVTAAFVPMFCVALNVCEELADEGIKTVELWGMGLLGKLLLRLLEQDEDLSFSVEKKEAKDEIWAGLNSGVWDCEERAIVALDSDLLSQVQRHSALKNDPPDQHIQFIDLTRPGILKESITHDRIQEISRRIGKQELEVTSLIAQHIHAEHMEQFIRQAAEGFFEGKTVVYDW
ncbi:hypothetical protein NSQ91_12095 [Paenibacillus sp. FSL R7-0048]|uniref:hypothetical protein n=1 Tax=Paenibacillus TaxID=44249 RepID=UPI00096D45E9|nr:hypothetical protein [Paenibacillus odorifer]OMD64427.1 hypothetical protein BSK48_25065 [Paenibacillus odorifer]OMD72264.1 hypothetical protein BSK50_24400 [Paenibacillus odorifer]OMD87456.1 hypothetical protein BSK53_00125 [Paenibacillus odorifer]